ncbi:MAG: hypothetical protein Kow0037_18620 [Calditrichia bacterium]
MRHRKKIYKLGRSKSHREATLRNIARAMIEHHQIKTTLAKAKAARSFVERLITHGKKDTVAARRLAFKFLQNHQLVKVLFDEIAPTFADRNGGYTRIIKLGHRQGDGAELAILQLVGFEENVVEEKKKSAKKTKASPKKSEGKKAAPEKVAEEEVAKAESAEAPEETPVEEKSEATEEKPAEEPVETKTEEAQPETPAEEKAEEKTEEKPKEDKASE